MTRAHVIYIVQGEPLLVPTLKSFVGVIKPGITTLRLQNPRYEEKETEWPQGIGENDMLRDGLTHPKLEDCSVRRDGEYGKDPGRPEESNSQLRIAS